MLAYYDAVLDLGLKLHECIALDLGLPETHFKPIFKDPLATLRLVTYPPGTGLDNEVGAGAHTDYGSISFIIADDEPALQARLRNGEWIDLPPDRDSFIIMVGDTMERWSNGRYVATPHRVQPPRHRRHALVFHVDPAPHVPVAPLPELGTAEADAQTYEQYLS
ncbi:MAG: 2OG-Fe(II) oxygenase family protein, partial [Pikeienuella sp.]